MKEIKFRYYEKDNGMVYAEPDTYNMEHFFGAADRNNNLMQYIGLKDKNGQDIYEGDIVKGEIWFQENILSIKGQIEQIHCRYIIAEYNCSLYQFSNNFNGKGIEIEVIGNKYENSDLI